MYPRSTLRLGCAIRHWVAPLFSAKLNNLNPCRESCEVRLCSYMTVVTWELEDALVTSYAAAVSYAIQ